MPQISIIIPVYNAEKYLKNTLDCLLSQTLKELEIICINDCSKDSSLDILKEYSKKDDRIKIIDLEENVGAAVARNKGLEIAQGEYLGFVDSDDEIDLNFYEKLYTKAVETNADIVKSACKITQLDGSVEVSNLNDAIENINKFRFEWQWWCAIYKRSFIDENSIKFPDKCIKGQDSVFLNKAILKSNSLELVNDVFYHYIRRADSLDSNMLSPKKMDSIILARDLMSDDLNSGYLTEINVDDYGYRYSEILKMALNSLFRTSDIEVKKLVVNNFVEMYEKCVNKHSMEQVFSYPMLLNLIKEKKYTELSEFLIKCKNKKELKYAKMTFLQKLFSIQKYGNRKLLTVLGIKMKIKR